MLWAGFAGSLAYAQQEEGITTIIVIRHAEKADEAGNSYPGLSAAGLKRAQKIAELLSQEAITAVYATPYQRTKQTVMPLAAAQKISIQEYSPIDEKAFKAMLESNTGGKIVICAHSNTVPVLLTYFTRTQNFTTLAEQEYDKVFIISKSNSGASSTLKLVVK
ncbi:phosphoglycerate mutase [Flammeovirgaceae bacterium 311]|nr:phosphoglycerate mutase [Flammeovirgaceae bacterium 311]